MLERRWFLTGLASALAAPAIVRAASLMPVKAALWTPPAVEVLPSGWTEVWGYKLYYDSAKSLVRVEQIDPRDILVAAG